jgi:hypothetical protein
MRHALGQSAEFSAGQDVVVLVGATLLAFALTALLFDPEQRFVGRAGAGGRGTEPAPESP